MKRFWWVLVMMLCIVTAQAQTVGVAVLTHGDAKTMFYGNTALLQAVEAATEGDVISLSPGTFNGLKDFSKSGLTIIGSGMDEGPSQTILTEFKMKANNNEERFVKLTLKNVFINSAFWADNGNYELSLHKCRLLGNFNCSIAPEESSVIEMVNCVSGSSNDTFNNTVLNAYNSVLHNANLDGDVSRSRVLSNCILLGTPGGTGSLYDCIIYESYSYATLASSVRATNCIALISAWNDYLGSQKLANRIYNLDFDAFVEGSFYELKPELASEWVDENGEQIGIYGGPEPFSAIPNAPRFTKFNVPTKTDADGKLPVEIEIAMPAK